MTLRETSKPAPLYERVKQHVLDRVNRGEWADGARLPSELELVETLGVSRMTVHRALRELSAAGLISRIQGVGSFVAARLKRTGLLEIRDIAEEIISHGHRHRAQVVRLEAVRAGVELATAFDLRPGAKVFHSLIVHQEDDLPVQLEERYVTPYFSPDYLKQDFEAQTTNRYLQNIAPATEVEQIVFAVTPEAEACRLLEIDAGEPCLLLSRRTWLGGAPATKSLFTYPGSRYSLGSRYKVADGAPR
jgi:GntR family transcriptional regulator, histidine utilization repressor